MKTPLTVLILTYNEEIHLKRLILKIKDWAGQIVIVDSFSHDGTVELAKNMGCEVMQNRYEYPAQQLNWSLQHIDFKYAWILNLDADEWPTKELKEEIARMVSNDKNPTNAYMIKRRYIYKQRWIKHGGLYPFWVIRLFRKGCGSYENIRMDEKYVPKGLIGKLRYDLVDENLKGVNFWIQKHNEYAKREAHDVLSSTNRSLKQTIENFKETKSLRRLFKYGYYRFPMLLRPMFYFVFRYVFLLGFLDGKAGFEFHFLQACWYRFLVDAYLWEAKQTKSASVI